MREKIYRINILVQEYDGEGFWDVFNSIEMADNKVKLIESFDKIAFNGKEYIEKRLI